MTRMTDEELVRLETAVGRWKRLEGGLGEDDVRELLAEVRRAREAEAALRAEVAETIASHQRANAELARVEDENDALRARIDAPGTEAPPHPADCDCTTCAIRMGGSLED